MTSRGPDREWIEAVTGGRVERLEPMAGGGSRSMWALDVVDGRGDHVALVVRSETGAGPFSGTAFGSLAREAEVYRALSGALPVPGLVALAPDGRSLVATRVQGSNDFGGIADPGEKASVRRSYIEHLAALHAIGPDSLDLPSLPRPGPGGQAEGWLGVWKRLFEERVRRPAPLLRFAVAWLGDHAPGDEEPPVVCHGDVGPGNFLHRDGAVSALLDWELCHLGDRHDDLGMLALRGHQLNGFGDLDEDLRTYEEASGRPVDVARVRYYRAVALVLGLTTSLMQLDAPGERRIELPLFLHLVPTLELLLARALAELLGVELDEPSSVEGVEDPVASDVVRALRGELVPSRAEGAVLGAGPGELLDHLDAAARLATPLDGADRDELGALLGSRPASYRDGLARVDQAVAEGAIHPEAFVGWAFRSGRRRAALWPAWAPAMAMRLLPIGSPGLAAGG